MEFKIPGVQLLRKRSDRGDPISASTERKFPTTIIMSNLWKVSPQQATQSGMMTVLGLLKSGKLILRSHPTQQQNHKRQSHHRDTQSRTRGSLRRTSSVQQQLLCTLLLINVSVTSLPRHLFTSLFPYYAFTHLQPTPSGAKFFGGMSTHDSPASRRMEKRHSDVVSGNQTIVLSFRICCRCSLTHYYSGRFYWWCRLRHILADVGVHLCRNQSAPDRIRVYDHKGKKPDNETCFQNPQSGS